MSVAAIIERVFRGEGPRVLAGLVRALGDIDLAEDALQDAVTRAAERWPSEGIPDNPAAWLTTVARRRGTDLLRRRATRGLAALPSDVAAPAIDEAPLDPAAVSGVEDDRLRLLFTVCHPALAQTAQVALALRTLGGLTTTEIARAFLEPEATTAQRIVRAKKKIRDAGIPYEVPPREFLEERVAAVLSVIYLVFNEGYAATSAGSLVRPTLCREAIRLGRLVVELLPDEAEAAGLLALMLLHDARRATRLAADGGLATLDEQDRALWDRDAIAEGTSILENAVLRRRSGPYQIQAAVAALHARAAAPADTDWPQIAALYGALLRHNPTPVVELNAAAALAMATTPDSGLQWLDTLERRCELADYHLLPAARADLLRRAGRLVEARVHYERALALATGPAERIYLERRLRQLP